MASGVVPPQPCNAAMNRPNPKPTTATLLARFFGWVRRQLIRQPAQANMSEIAVKVRDKLGPEGVGLFKHIRDVHGGGKRVSIVITGGGHIHPVHFREGMFVRNFLRSLPETKNWTDIDYDDRWEQIVLEAIK